MRMNMKKEVNGSLQTVNLKFRPKIYQNNKNTVNVKDDITVRYLNPADKNMTYTIIGKNCH